MASSLLVPAVLCPFPDATPPVYNVCVSQQHKSSVTLLISKQQVPNQWHTFAGTDVRFQWSCKIAPLAHNLKGHCLLTWRDIPLVVHVKEMSHLIF